MHIELRRAGARRRAAWTRARPTRRHARSFGNVTCSQRTGARRARPPLGRLLPAGSAVRRPADDAQLAPERRHRRDDRLGRRPQRRPVPGVQCCLPPSARRGPGKRGRQARRWQAEYRADVSGLRRLSRPAGDGDRPRRVQRYRRERSHRSVRARGRPNASARSWRQATTSTSCGSGRSTGGHSAAATIFRRSVHLSSCSARPTGRAGSIAIRASSDNRSTSTFNRSPSSASCRRAFGVSSRRRRTVRAGTVAPSLVAPAARTGRLQARRANDVVGAAGHRTSETRRAARSGAGTGRGRCAPARSRVSRTAPGTHAVGWTHHRRRRPHIPWRGRHRRGSSGHGHVARAASSRLRMSRACCSHARAPEPRDRGPLVARRRAPADHPAIPD